MIKKVVCVFFVFLVSGIACLSAQMSKAQLQQMYVNHLRSEGYNPSIDSDGDVNFTAQGQNFYIDVIDNDLQSFHLVLTNFLDIGGESNRLKALNAASAITRTTRVVRVYITSSGRIAIDTYIYIANPEDFRVHLNRLISVMITARTEFVAAMR